MDRQIELYLHNVSNLPGGAPLRRVHHHTPKTPVWVPPRETKLMAGKRLALTPEQIVKYRPNFERYIEEGLCELRTGYGKKVLMSEVSEEGVYLDAPRPKPAPREVEQVEREEASVEPNEPEAPQAELVEEPVLPPAVPVEELPAPAAFESAFEEADEVVSEDAEESEDPESEEEDADADEVSDVGEATPAAPRGAPVQSKASRKRGRRNR